MSKCKGCGKTIVWGMTEAGKKIPLDPKPPVYRVLDENPEPNAYMENVKRAQRCYVSHFATCPKANEFSRKGPS